MLVYTPQITTLLEILCRGSVKYLFYLGGGGFRGGGNSWSS